MCRKENFAGLQAPLKRGKSARASPTPHHTLNEERSARALSIQPKIPVISVGTSNGKDHFGLVRPEYSGPALKVVLFDRSGHFGRSAEMFLSI